MPEHLLQQPVAIFLIIIAVIFIAPLLSEKARLPGIVGLILGGILIGEHGLKLLTVSPAIELFGTVGLIYLMFNAGLEIDLDQFQIVHKRSLVFAILSFVFPQASGILIGRYIGLNWGAAVLLGSLYASQTLVAYPVLKRLGIIRNEAISISIGATIFTDVLSLLVLAVVVESQGQSISLLILLRLILLTAGYALFILLGVPRLGREFFRRIDGKEVEFQFLLVVLFIAAVLAELIGLHPIVGAFLTGLAINLTLPRESRAVQQILFLGESFFVPMFAISVGMRLDPAAIFINRETLLIGIALTAAVFITKFMAAGITSWIYNFSKEQMLTIWGISQAQAAATLATVLVAVEEDILTERIFNATFLMILVTAIASPIIVDQFGKYLSPPREEEKQQTLFQRVMVPIWRDDWPKNLLGLGALLARTDDGKMLVLNLAQAEKTLKKRREKLKSNVLKDPDTEIELRDRHEKVSAKGILKEAVESNVSSLIVEWTGGENSKGRIFDKLVDQIIWDSKIPVLAIKFIRDYKSLQRIVMVVAAQTVGVKMSEDSIDLAINLAKNLDIPLKIITTEHYLEMIRTKVENLKAEKHRQIQEVDQDEINTIFNEFKESDLIVLPSMGSQARFLAESSHLPYKLYHRTESSLAVIHFPS